MAYSASSRSRWFGRGARWRGRSQIAHLSKTNQPGLFALDLYNGYCTVMDMNRRELVAELSRLGWYPVRQGKHEIFGKAGVSRTIPVPRHRDINAHTAAAILRRAQEE
jgi:predicted RNA binding protein YcfA (HicA-like mRNA interferase family)